ncbi:radical SAM family heme chaperone HemW [Thermomicrobium sp. 4228-Ro]|uniref:radical SAM family heme chaperone HemW n=1 Tax=Thermomicrobium sp. 4228-Ro TaxID=2993937 RepID=UPI0022493E75|nr:radical SAM family heme chaperone HemW [Thermomicrobium sp. 4228-Ro]MCX2726656.1 radical SAM family heme chaperone HemW [Thermomicrobium sp. 4228-Ro]
MLTALSETLPQTSAPQPRDAPWGLYIHIPFCRRICPYCDFNVYARQEPLIPAYLAALTRELELIAARWGRGPLQTIYLGGGTPSLLEPGQIAAVLEAIARTFDVLPGAEVSLEANPETVDRNKLAGYRSAGVNRLSIGVQTLAPHGLKVLGRAHRPEMPERAFRAARDAGFENVNLDLISGWPGQTRADWLHDLSTVLSWEPEHLSLYALTIEPGTPYERGVQRGVLRPLDDDAVAELAELAMDLLAQRGYEHYEVSNWARERSFRSRHNQIYWRNGWYIGAGAGAHGYLGGIRMVNERLPARYIERVRAGDLPVREEEPIDPRTEAIETMILGIRLVTDGISARSFHERHGRDLWELYRAPIEELQDLGLVEWDGEQLRLTRRGILVANEVAVRFLEPLW